MKIMKMILKTAVLVASLALILLLDVTSEVTLQVQLVPEAQAILGVRRRSFRRGVVVGASVGAAEASSAEKSQAAPAQQQAAPAAPPAAAPPPPAPAAAGKPLPVGTVVQALPAGCTSTPVGGVEYYYCGGNFYRAVFQGNQLVYVTAKP